MTIAEIYANLDFHKKHEPRFKTELAQFNKAYNKQFKGKKSYKTHEEFKIAYDHDRPLLDGYFQAKMAFLRNLVAANLEAAQES